ncbi:MAG: MmcQ/YjbR family DNA-binding protein [Solirubrobacteraceae bacterium]
MATWDDVRRIALSLPDTAERFIHGSQGWHVHGKGFVWERPLRKADLQALGEAAPKGPILGARVEHLEAKQALIADAPEIYFTIPHFDRYAGVLVLLERIPLDELRELVVEAWLARAPKRLARDYLATHTLEG